MPPGGANASRLKHVGSSGVYRLDAGTIFRVTETVEFYFAPTVLTGTAGQTITIELKDEGSLPHNFTLDDQNIDQDVAPGSNAAVTVTFPQSGILQFHCKYHFAMGMVGELSVS